MADPGEEIAGAWLRYCGGCDFVDFDVQIVNKQGEIDVIGLDHKNSRAYVCEVASHIQGLDYGDNTTKTIVNKFKRAQEYAAELFEAFEVHYMFWSPVVRQGQQIKSVKDASNELYEKSNLRLELVVNDKYVQKLDELRSRSRELTRNASNQVVRVFQIEENARRYAATLEKASQSSKQPHNNDLS